MPIDDEKLLIQLTSSQRSAPLLHTIDPGFVHYRKIETILGSNGMAFVDREIEKLPDMPEYQKKVRIDHIYTRCMLEACRVWKIKTLSEALHDKKGHMFCSTEQLAPCPTFYEDKRSVSKIIPKGNVSEKIELHYTTDRVTGDTLRSELRTGAPISIIATGYSKKDGVYIFEPLVMGFPWLEDGEGKEDFGIEWFGHEFYEQYIEDIDEFKKVKDVSLPSSPEPMRQISEPAFKACLAKLLGDKAPKDWGGEQSDYFSAHLHLQGRTTPTAFLLKGPGSGFAPMGLNHLGKNNDQIFRLANEPATMFIVQHCHDILQAVRATLRAFAVQPGRPRRYCFMDGRKSLQFLQAYDLYDEALTLSKKQK